MITTNDGIAIVVLVMVVIFAAAALKMLGDRYG